MRVAHSVFEYQPWIIKLRNWIRFLYEDTKVAIVGHCFGHEIIAYALRLPVQRNPQSWEVSVCELTLSQVGRSVFGANKLVRDPSSN